jgi:hypothetical protein
MEGQLMPSSLKSTKLYFLDQKQEPQQKRALASRVKKSGSSASHRMRQAVDASVAGVTVDELAWLDEGARRAKEDIDAMIAGFKKNSDEHAKFMRALAAVGKN